MKTTLILILAATTVAVGALCVVQSRKCATQQTQLASLRGEVQAQSQQLEELQVAKKRSDQQRRDLLNQAEELAGQMKSRTVAAPQVPIIATPPPPPAAESDKADDEKGGFGKMLSKMMQDPDTRELIRTQQRLMMDQMYSPLIKRLGLTPEETTQFKNLLTDHMMSAADQASSMFGALGTTNSAATIKSLGDQQKGFDEQVKSFLGDDRYAQYKEYEETMGERMMLTQFKQQAGSDYNLTDQQSEALLNLMKEEKKSVAATTGLPLGDANKDPAKLQALLSDDKVGELLKAQETVGQRVYDRARTFLSADQLDTLGKFQTNQLAMTRMGMTMAKKMFAPGNAAGGGTAEPK